MLAQSIESRTVDTSREALGMLLFQMVRKFAADHSDDEVNRNKELRTRIIEQAKKEARVIIPEATDAEWTAGLAFLARTIRL